LYKKTPSRPAGNPVGRTWRRVWQGVPVRYTRSVIQEIRARTLLSRVSGIDTWFGLDFGMNLYRGCQHHCIYCDSRSECYKNDRFDDEVLVKTNAIDVLRDELRRKRVRGVIGTGSMNDPYMPIEAEVRLAARALEAIADFGFGVHVVTKSTLVLRDIALLQKIGRRATAAVSLTLTTLDDALARVIEPGAPLPSDRLDALREIARAGIEARVALMPVLPFVEDSWDNVRDIVERAAECGARAVVASFGVTLRDRQRAYFYARLDERFPGLRERYAKLYGDRYVCASPDAEALRTRFEALCAERGLRTSVRPMRAPSADEPGLFS
jgi:DNA repair photolyase